MIFQTYYNERSKSLIQEGFTGVENSIHNGFYENNAISRIYKFYKGNARERLLNEFWGVTSARFTEKTGLISSDLIDFCNKNKHADIIIYSPTYNFIDFETQEIVDMDMSKMNAVTLNHGDRTDIGKVVDLINKAKILPFDLLEVGWEYCFCNYWLAKKVCFDEYNSLVLLPTLEHLNRKDLLPILNKLQFIHRGKKDRVEPYFLELLFGSYLSWKKKTSNIIVKSVSGEQYKKRYNELTGKFEIRTNNFYQKYTV